MLLTVEIDARREVLESLKEIPDVKEAHRLYGIYDFIICIESETMQELKDLINRIRDIEKIRSTMPLICIKEGDVQVDLGKRA